MPDPTAAAASAAGPVGLAVLAAALGIDPALMVVGGSGALWAQFYLPEMPVSRRLLSIALGALIAAWTAPATIRALPQMPGWPNTLAPEGFLLPVALLVGLLFHVGGGLILRVLAARVPESPS